MCYSDIKRSTPSLTWLNCLHYISSVVVLLAQACRFDARLSAVSVTSMRNRLKNSWCEREDFVWRRCEMLPHFSLSPSWERSSLFSPRLVRKQRTRRSETTALNTAPPSPWQPALAHPRRAPHGFALHLTQKAHPDVWLPLGQTFGCGQDRTGVERTGRGVMLDAHAQTHGKRTQLYSTDTFPRCSRQAFRRRAAELLLKLRNPRCCNASKSTLNY